MRLIKFLATNKMGAVIFIIWLTGAVLLVMFMMTACVSTPKATSFDGRWEIDDHTPPRACLYEEDVKKLRELLIRCESK